MDEYVAMTRPITLLLKDNNVFYWNEECDCGFTQVKDALAFEPILLELAQMSTSHVTHQYSVYPML